MATPSLPAGNHAAGDATHVTDHNELANAAAAAVYAANNGSDFANLTTVGVNLMVQPDMAIAATVTSGATLVANVLTPVNASAGAITMTLPTPTALNQQLAVEKIDTSTNAITVSGTLRGVAGSITLQLPSENVVLAAESLSSWRPLSSHKTLSSLDGRYSAYGATAVTYGTSAGTAAQGNDTRIVNASAYPAAILPYNTTVSAYPARPSSTAFPAGTVWYQGPSQPTDWIINGTTGAADIWLNTTTNTTSPSTLTPSWSGAGTADSPPAGTVGTAYSYTFMALNSPTSFTSTGTLPAGLSLSTGGVLSGTPTTVATYTFTVTATNTTGSATTGTLSVAVAAAGSVAAPVFTADAPPSATVSIAYSYTFTASNSPTTWAVASGSLPAGLSLSTSTGVLSGTPTTAGTSTFTVTAANANPTPTSTGSLSIVTASGPTVITDSNTVSRWGGTDCTLAQSTAVENNSTASIACTISTASTLAYIHENNGIAVTAGTAYSFTAYVYPTVASRKSLVQLGWYTATSSGTFISNTTGTSGAITANTWNTVTVTGVAPSGAAGVFATIQESTVSGNNTVGEVFYVSFT